MGMFVIRLIVELITNYEVRHPFVLSYNYYVNEHLTQLSIYRLIQHVSTFKSCVDYLHNN